MPHTQQHVFRTLNLRQVLRASAVFLVLGAALLASAQNSGEGTITGTVTDSSGAAVAHATVTATSVATHVASVRTSTSTGVYTIAPLIPGLYTLTVEASGFKTVVQNNLDVTALNSLGFNPVMSAGLTTETVTVTDAPPVLDTDSATLGTVIENEAYSNLPLAFSTTQERDPTAFALLSAGAQPGTDGRLPSLSGTPGHQAALYLDGVPSETLNQQGDNRTVSLALDVDAVDQFQVITSVPPAQYSGAGAENFTLKSGSLQFHGEVSEFVRNTAFDTFNFSQKQATVNSPNCPATPGTCPAPKSVEHANEFSAVGGGYIPHTGKKVFFFLAYDRFHGRSGTAVNFTTIPTAAEEMGDFTELNTYNSTTKKITPGGLTGVAGDPSAGGTNPAFLYDPMSNSCNAAGLCTRLPFMGLKNGIPTYNVIPASAISDISKKLESALPNYPGSPNAGHINNVDPTLLSGNYANQGTNGRDNYNWDWRFDYDVTNRHRISTIGVMGHDVYATNFSNFYNDAPYTTGNLPIIVPKQYNVEDAYTFTPHLTNQFKYGYTRFYMPLIAPTVGSSVSPGAFGITNLPGGQAAQDFPQISFGTSTANGGASVAPATWGATPSTQSTQLTIPNNYALVDNVQYLRGSHLFTVGFAFQWQGLNNANPATLTSIFPLSYGQAATANFVANSSSIDSTKSGYGYASFLIGAVSQVNSYSLNYAPTQYTRVKTYAPYVEDHWKITPKLTIDVGLRWDYLPPVHEKAIPVPAGNFTFSYLNPAIQNPAAGFNGALEFAGDYGGNTGTISCGCKTPIQTYWKNFGPRVGIVYAVDATTVFRAGVGITYSQGGGTGGGILSGGVGGANSSGQILGSSVSISSPAASSNGATAGPSFYLSNNTAYLGANANSALFGPGFAYPTPPAPGAATQSLNAGNYLNASGQVVVPQAMGYDDPYHSGRAPEYTFYNLGLERTITRNMTISVAYVGSESHHTYNKGAQSPRGYWNNQLNPAYLLSLGPLAGANSKGVAKSIPLLLAPATSANVAIMNFQGNVPTPANATNFINAANASPGTSSLTIGQLLTAFPQYSQVQDSWGGPNTENFNYNSFQLVLSQRVNRNLTFNVAYTYSKNVGDDGAFRSGFDIPAGAVDGSTQSWKADRIDRGRVGIDIPELLNIYGVYKLPLGSPGHFGGGSLLTRELIGGWQVSGIYQYSAGTPIAVTWSGGCANAPVSSTTSGSIANNCVPSYNPAYTGTGRQNGPYGTGPNGVVLTNKTISYLDSAAFVMPRDVSTVPGFHQYLIGNASRTAPYGLRNPGTQNGGNASLRRSFILPRETSFVFQADVLNLWNKQTWGGPNAGWNGATYGQSGAPSAIRAFQFAGRIVF